MKRLLSLLAILTVTPVASLALNTVVNSNQHSIDATANFTDLGKVGSLVRMSDTTGIVGGSAFFDSTKVDEESQALSI